MADVLLKLRALLYLFPRVSLWWREVGCRNLDDRECCNGYMCGCYGSTIRQRVKYQLNEANNDED